MSSQGNGINKDSYRVEINDNVYEIIFDENGFEASLNGKIVTFDICLEREPDLFSMLVDGKSIMMSIEDNEEQNRFRVHAGGYDFDTEVVTSREAYLREFIQTTDVGKRETIVKSPMPGLIVKNILTEGAEVKKGQGVIIMEAMKMENEIKAPAEGLVLKYHVIPGDAVEKGQVLFEIG